MSDMKDIEREILSLIAIRDVDSGPTPWPLIIGWTTFAAWLGFYLFT